MTRRGTLYLVVGPSGAGKDTLIAAARQVLADDPGWVFPQRVIDRPGSDDTERHVPVSTARQSDGAFALSWRAHGHHYGIPTSAIDALATGRNVVVNVSRAVIADAAAQFPPVHVIEIAAPENVRATRLAARQRELATDQQQRLARPDPAVPHGPPRTVVLNDGALDEAINLFLRALRT